MISYFVAVFQFYICTFSVLIWKYSHFDPDQGSWDSRICNHKKMVTLFHTCFVFLLLTSINKILFTINYVEEHRNHISPKSSQIAFFVPFPIFHMDGLKNWFYCFTMTHRQLQTCQPCRGTVHSSAGDGVDIHMLIDFISNKTFSTSAHLSSGKIKTRL